MGRSRVDLALLFSTRALRLFGYGFLSVTLVLYLIALGFAESSVGLLLSLALLGDVILSLWITTSADRLGRRWMLVVSALLIVFAGAVLASTSALWLIGVAALVGVLSPSGYDVGPFLSIEQAALAQIVVDRDRTRLFAWYNLVGALATALGALLSGVLVQSLLRGGLAPLSSYRATTVLYAGFGLPPLEAMASGTPVVTSNVSSLPEVAGDAAVLVDPYSPEAIADGIHRVLTDEALRGQLRVKGPLRAKQFSWAQSVGRIREIYGEVDG